MSMTASLAKQGLAGKWQPLLVGDQRQRALEAIERIAEALPAAMGPKAIWNTDHPSALQLSLLTSWKAEVALFYAYSAKALGNDQYAEQALRYLNEAIDEAPEHLDSLWLFGGFTGIGWIIANLSETLFDQDETENCGSVDELLTEHLAQPERQSNYDLVVGLVGQGVYALDRLRNAAGVASDLLTRIVNKLWETAEHDGPFITWHTSPVLLPEWQRQICPNGYYNLGLAHGVPGIIALLGRIVSAGIEPERSRHLLEGAVRWLLAQKGTAESESYFSTWAGRGIEREASKVAWCYGDLGIGMALLYAAKCVGQANWEQEATEILLKAATRSGESAGVFDVSLCHGAAGNAHIFNRAFQATGEARFRTAALAWYEQALAFQRPGQGIGGFSIGDTDEAGTEVFWTNKPGLLDGVAGVGLSLLAACTDWEPNWDRSLLISIPPKSR